VNRLINALSFLVVVLGGFIASRAFGADGAPAAGPAWLPALGTLAENPAVIVLGAELTTRLFPTRRKASLFFLLRNLFRFLAAVCDRLAESPIAQVRRKPRAPKAAAPESKDQAP
jgi:hypothetical protein